MYIFFNTKIIFMLSISHRPVSYPLQGFFNQKIITAINIENFESTEIQIVKHLNINIFPKHIIHLWTSFITKNPSVHKILTRFSNAPSIRTFRYSFHINTNFITNLYKREDVWPHMTHIPTFHKPHTIFFFLSSD